MFVHESAYTIVNVNVCICCYYAVSYVYSNNDYYKFFCKSICCIIIIVYIYE